MTLSPAQDAPGSVRAREIQAQQRRQYVKPDEPPRFALTSVPAGPDAPPAEVDDRPPEPASERGEALADAGEGASDEHDAETGVESADGEATPAASSPLLKPLVIVNAPTDLVGHNDLFVATDGWACVRQINLAEVLERPIPELYLYVDTAVKLSENVVLRYLRENFKTASRVVENIIIVGCDQPGRVIDKLRQAGWDTGSWEPIPTVADNPFDQ